MLSNLKNSDDEIRPLTNAQAALAALPFLLFGISTLVEKLNFFQAGPAGAPALGQVLILHPFLAFNWLILIGLAIAILAGFPRWGYSFFGWALLFGWWWSDWKIWLSFLAVWLVALALRRSIQPLRTMAAGLWKDWTLFSFAIYILYSWTYIGYDENHHPYLLIFVIATALATALGAWGYFRSGSPLRHILALVGGLALATVLNGINSVTWDYQSYYGFPEGDNSVILVPFIFLGVLTAIMVGNGLLAAWRLARSRMKRLSQ